MFRRVHMLTQTRQNRDGTDMVPDRDSLKLIDNIILFNCMNFLTHCICLYYNVQSKEILLGQVLKRCCRNHQQT